MKWESAEADAAAQREDTRVVLLDEDAEQQWMMRNPGRQWLRCSTNDLRAADEWLEQALTRDEIRVICAEWAGRQLGLDRATALNISPPLHGPFSKRLLENHESNAPQTPHLCTEVLGWTPRLITDPLDRWTAFARLLPAESLPVWLLNATENFTKALHIGDRLALAGLPIGLRVTREQWSHLIATDAWDRCATRWRLAPVFPNPDGAPPQRTSDRTEQYLRQHLPSALPLLEQACATAPGELGCSEAAERARSAAEALLHAVLEAHPGTHGRFKLNAPLDFSFGTRHAEGDLTAPDARLVVEIDGYYHFRDPEAYRRDRRKDALLQEHGWFVMRFLADDVVSDLEGVLRGIERTLARREITKVSQHIT